jgi:hypothetical protein
VGFQHIVAKHAAQIVEEMRQVARFEKLERPPVDLENLDEFRAGLHALRARPQKLAERGHAFRAPAVEEILHRAEILQPQRHGRELEHLSIVVHVLQPLMMLACIGEGHRRA